METDHPDAQWTASRRRNGPAVAILGALAGAAVTAGLAWWLAAEEPPAPEPPGAPCPSWCSTIWDCSTSPSPPTDSNSPTPPCATGVRGCTSGGLDRFEDVELPDTEGAQQPFFSPDGSAVGFFAGRT